MTVQSVGCFASAGCVCTGSSPPACSGQTQAPVLQLLRDANTGALTSAVLGISTTGWAYNSFGELVAQQSTQGATALYAESLTRDKLGRITNKVETITGVTVVREYEYDARGRLQQVQEDGVLVSGYVYDPNGNRLSRSTSTSSLTGVYDDRDRLVSYGGVDYEYSADGELTTKTIATTGAATTYDYDELGNLLEVELPDSRVIEYEVDAQNRRVGRKVDGVVTHRWLYQNQLKPIAELDGSGTLVSLFVYGTRSQVPDLMLRAGVTYRIISDHVGSVRLVVNLDTGAIAQRLDYDEFGNVLVDTNPDWQPFGFAGGCTTRTPGSCGLGQGTTTRCQGGGRRKIRYCSVGEAPTSMATSGTTR